MVAAGDSQAPSDFVSKLYQMLETPEYSSIVRWGDHGDSFVIHDTMLFQQLVIPQVFNHANFSSFVRQLNKYDFHKVKFTDPQSRLWEFQHPDFRRENRDRPHLIRRKPPAASRKGMSANAPQGQSREQAQRAGEKAASRIAQEINRPLLSDVQDLHDRIDHLESTQRQLLRALKMQQSLVERVLTVVDLPDSDVDSPDRKGLSENLNQGSASPAPTPQPPNSYVALLAVDDPESRDVVASFLERYGCMVELAENGLELVQKSETAPPDVIVADVVLSYLDGMSATELIRQTNIGVPIILMAENQPPPNTDQYILRGASSTLVRPFSRSELWRTLAMLLEPKVSDMGFRGQPSPLFGF